LFPRQNKAQDFVFDPEAPQVRFDKKRYFEFSGGFATSLSTQTLGVFQGPGRPAIPPLSSFVEYRMGQVISIGAGFHYEEIRTRNIGPGSRPPSQIPIETGTRYNIGLRTNFFLTSLIVDEAKLKSRDYYIGFRIGYQFHTGNFSPGSILSAGLGNRYFMDRNSNQLYFGHAHYFNNRWGLFGEAGLGGPYFFILGLRYRG
jgi:hypothetical protein